MKADTCWRTLCWARGLILRSVLVVISILVVNSELMAQMINFEKNTTITSIATTPVAMTTEKSIQQATPHFFEAQWKVVSSNMVQNSELNSKNRFMLSGTTKLNMNFHPQLRLVSEMSLNLFSTQGQDQFVEDANNGVVLKEGLLEYTPLTNRFFNASLSLGAVNQSFVPTRLFISHNRAFPGLKEEVCLFMGKKSCLKLKAEQVIPTSYSLSTQRTEKEAQPSLHAEILEYDLDQPLGLQFKGFGGFYQYANLTAVTADRSAKFGNSVQGEGALARFKYDYAGWVLGTKFSYKFKSDFLVGFSGHLLKNEKTLYEKSKAQMASLFVDVPLKNLVLSPEVQYHFIEQDATVAAYMTGSFNMTNTEGFTALMGLKFKKYGFKIISYVSQIHALAKNATYTSVISENEQIYGLRLETEYASF